MLKLICVLAAASALALSAPAAEANGTHHRHYKSAYHVHHAHRVHHKHRYANRHRVRIVYSDKYGVLRLGRHRAGPPYGYKFGFATYAGDPFASDDYFDGHRCYYLHRRDFCLSPNRAFDPFSSVDGF
jgi:hypothetical protein